MDRAPLDDPLLAHTGDPAAAELLRRNLAAIGEEHRGTPMAHAIRQVLAGERDLADLEREPAFMELVRGGVRRYEEHLASLSPEEKALLYAEAAEIAERETS